MVQAWLISTVWGILCSPRWKKKKCLVFKVRGISISRGMSFREIVLQCITSLLCEDTQKYCHSKLGIMPLFLLFASWMTTSTDPVLLTICLGLLLTASSLSLHPDILCISLSCFWAHYLLQFGYEKIKCEMVSYVFTQYLTQYCFPGSSGKESFSTNSCQLMTA